MGFLKNLCPRGPKWLVVGLEAGGHCAKPKLPCACAKPQLTRSSRCGDQFCTASSSRVKSARDAACGNRKYTTSNIDERSARPPSPCQKRGHGRDKIISRKLGQRKVGWLYIANALFLKINGEAIK